MAIYDLECLLCEVGCCLIENEKDRGLVKNVHLIGIKQRVWDLKTSPKIKLFLWKVLLGALAVAEKLQFRDIPLDTTCKLCGGAVDTICHMLFGCPVLKQLLDLANISSPVNGFLLSSVVFNVCFLLNMMKKDEISYQIKNSIMWVLWTVWKNRNATILSGKKEDLACWPVKL